MAARVGTRRVREGSTVEEQGSERRAWARTRLKAWAVASSLGGFGAFLFLAAVHVTGVTARAAAASKGAPDFRATENAFFGGSDANGHAGFGFGSGSGQSGTSAPAASTSVS
jgi:hypothetical protein